MEFFDFIMFISFVIALTVGPFVVGSRMPVMWLIYLFLCTVLTPIIGIPVYKAFCRYSFALHLSVTIFALLISNVQRIW